MNRRNGTRSTNRRDFLRIGGGLAGLAFATSTAGCLSTLGFETETRGSEPLVENRPDAVYVPTHVDGMEMAGMGRAGPYALSLSYSYPHRFWLVTGQERQRVEVTSDDAVHLMVRLWDAETGVVPPGGSVTVDVRRDGERVVERPPWPMLSQSMGFHFGDNVPLSGDGTYDVTVRVDPIQTRGLGAFQGRFEERAETELSFEFSQETLEGLSYRALDDRKGQRGAVEPMDMGSMGSMGGGSTEMDGMGGDGSETGGMEGNGSGMGEMEGDGMGMGSMPVAQLPTPEDLPGRTVGEASSGDGTFVVQAIDDPPAGVDGDGSYLAVSARTPYNRYPLPTMSITATLERDGEAVLSEPLVGSLDPDLHYHYGRSVGSIESGDVIALDFGAPPQVSRHEGYETAFLDFESVSITAP